MGFSTYKNNIQTVDGSGFTPPSVTGIAGKVINNNFITIANKIDDLNVLSNFRQVSSATTITNTDGTIFFDTTSGVINQTLPDGSSLGLNLPLGRAIRLKNIGTNNLVISGYSGQLLDGLSTITLTQYQVLTLVWDGSKFVPFNSSSSSGGGGGSDANAVINVPVASTTWTINHNLGKYPAVQAFEDLGSSGFLEVEGLIQHISINQLTITFNSSMSGKVVCN